MRIILGGHLGDGRQGDVFRAQDGQVAKITHDLREAAVAGMLMQLQGHGITVPGFPTVTFVGRIGDDHVILRDDVPDLEDEDHPDTAHALYYFSHGWACSSEESLEEALIVRPDLGRLLTGLRTIEEMTGIVVIDIGSRKNVGDGFVLRDFGTVRGDLEPWIREFPEADVVFEDDPEPGF